MVKSFKFRTGVYSDKLPILNAVWDRELGHFSKYWVLEGVKRGVLYIKPSSAAAAHELQLRGQEIVRSLNKHFSRPWIKAVRTAL